MQLQDLVLKQGLTHATARHGTARHDTARHGTARHGTARHGTARHGTARHGAARRGAARHGTLPGRLEFPTLRLTSSRSNRLCYGSMCFSGAHDMFCVVVFCALLLCVGLLIFGLRCPMMVFCCGLPLCPGLFYLRIYSVNCCFHTFGCDDVLF